MATRADRNNNPGNLRPGKDKIIWQGQTGTDADGFAVFSSVDWGIRAADLNLQTYAKNGLSTVSAVIHKWSATDQDTYTASVAQDLGVSSTQTLDLSNPAVRTAMLQAMFKVEGSANAGNNTTGSGLGSLAVAIANGTQVTPESLANLFKAPGEMASNVLDSVTSTVGGALNFDLGKWISDNLSGAIWDQLKDKIAPIALGAGALIFIALSAWALIKDTPAGGVIKSGAKVAALA